MLIPIGFFGAGGAAGSYELISTAYGTGSSGTITFSDVPSTYKHLQLRATSNISGGSINIKMQLNSDTGANYKWHRLYGQDGTVTSDNGGTGWIIGNMFSAPDTNIYGASVTDILDYASTSKNTTVRILSGENSTSYSPGVSLSSGLWLNTAAVTSITFTTFSGNFSSGSRFSLYGIKG